MTRQDAKLLNSYKWKWNCPHCKFTDTWTYLDFITRGSPVCPKCDIEMKPEDKDPRGKK